MHTIPQGAPFDFRLSKSAKNSILDEYPRPKGLNLFPLPLQHEWAREIPPGIVRDDWKLKNIQGLFLHSLRPLLCLLEDINTNSDSTLSQELAKHFRRQIKAAMKLTQKIKSQVSQVRHFSRRGGRRNYFNPRFQRQGFRGQNYSQQPHRNSFFPHLNQQFRAYGNQGQRHFSNNRSHFQQRTVSFRPNNFSSNPSQSAQQGGTGGRP